MINLIHGDCLEEMKNIDGQSINMILCDLPYGTTACKWDTVLDFGLLWNQYKRIIKERGAIVLFGSQPFTSNLVMSNPKWFRYEWIWQKDKGANIGVMKYQPMKYHENIVVFSKKAHKYHPQMEKRLEKNKRNNKPRTTWCSTQQRHIVVEKSRGNNDYKFPSSIQKCNTIRRGLHPTQKPVPLLEYLLKTYTEENDLVLDNCMGSGSTGVACKNLKRSFIGIEKDEEYYKIAKDRIGE
jgi:site-specific DNA-methyltransferase (adenine-specific)